MSNDCAELGDQDPRVIIGWRCDDCEEYLGGEVHEHDLVEQLRKEHEEETEHTTTVEAIREERIVPSSMDRHELGEAMLELAERNHDRIEWICPGCEQSDEELNASKRCPDCGERLREVMP